MCALPRFSRVLFQDPHSVLSRDKVALKDFIAKMEEVTRTEEWNSNLIIHVGGCLG